MEKEAHAPRLGLANREMRGGSRKFEERSACRPCISCQTSVVDILSKEGRGKPECKQIATLNEGGKRARSLGCLQKNRKTVEGAGEVESQRKKERRTMKTNGDTRNRSICG